MNIVTAIAIFLLGACLGVGAVCIWALKTLRDLDNELNSIIDGCNDILTTDHNVMASHSKVLSNILFDVSDAVGVDEVSIPVFGKINLKEFEFENEDLKLITREKK